MADFTGRDDGWRGRRSAAGWAGRRRRRWRGRPRDLIAAQVHALLVRDVVRALHDERIAAACGDLLGGPLTARRVVLLELLERLAGAGQDHHTRALRSARACRRGQRRAEHEYGAPPTHDVILYRPRSVERVAHWITSSARPRIEGDIVSPNALAVFRLMTNSNVVGCSTGRSPARAPL